MQNIIHPHHKHNKPNSTLEQFTNTLPIKKNILQINKHGIHYGNINHENDVLLVL